MKFMGFCQINEKKFKDLNKKHRISQNTQFILNDRKAKFYKFS